MIDILGKGLTLDSYDWERDSFRWGLSQCRGLYKGKINLYFALHEDQSAGLDNEIGLESFPLNEIIEWAGCNYFTNSIAYMIAYALYTGEKEIAIFGVDMDTESEYAYERPCVAYWIGYGRARGAKITIASGLTEPPYNYGYDSRKQAGALAALAKRRDAARHRAQQTTGAEREQWVGAMYATQKCIDLIRS